MNFFQKFRDFVKRTPKIPQHPVEDGSISFSVKSNGLWKRGIEFLTSPSHSRTMGAVIMLILVSAVSLTVYVAQQQQQLKQHAAIIDIGEGGAGWINICESNPTGTSCTNASGTSGYCDYNHNCAPIPDCGSDLSCKQVFLNAGCEGSDRPNWCLDPDNGIYNPFSGDRIDRKWLRCCDSSSYAEIDNTCTLVPKEYDGTIFKNPSCSTAAPAPIVINPIPGSPTCEVDCDDKCVTDPTNCPAVWPKTCKDFCSTSLSAPTLSSPTNGATGQSTTPTLSWSATAAPSDGWYHLYYFKKDSADLPTTVGNIKTSTQVISSLSSGTAYQWFVKACDKDNNCTQSAVWEFTTLASTFPAPGTPTEYIISANVFIDKDGSETQDAGEPKYDQNITFTLSGDASETATQGVPFARLEPAGDYVLSITIPSGYKATTPTSISITSLSARTDLNFGIAPITAAPPPTGSSCSSQKGYCRYISIGENCSSGYKDVGETTDCPTSGDAACCALSSTAVPTTCTLSDLIGDKYYGCNDSAGHKYSPACSDTLTSYNAYTCVDKVCTPVSQPSCIAPKTCQIESGTPTCVAPPKTVTITLAALTVQDDPTVTDSISPTSITVALSLLDSSMASKHSQADSTFNRDGKDRKKYNKSSSASMNVVTPLEDGEYYVFAKRGAMIAKSSFTFKGETAITADPTTLVFGDINGDKDINTADYNLLLSCYRKSADSADPRGKACTGTAKSGYLSVSNFDKNGKVDQIDYNTFLRGFRTWNTEGK